MLRTGLTGGIGAGKSTVARRLVERGAVLVDADRIAREVVAAGTDGLREVVGAFGERVLRADGELDRPALASLVFGDDDARRTLDGIVHPLVRARSDELTAAAPDDAIVVQDVPLLVEGAMAPGFALVVVVGVDAQERVARLVSARGMTEKDARARIAAQATDAQRRAAADVWLDNSGPEDDTLARVDALWDGRLVPFEENLRTGHAPPTGPPRLVDPDPTWPEQARRLAERVAAAVGGTARAVEHVGSTAVPGLTGRDVVDLQIAVDGPEQALRAGEALTAAGFPADPRGTADRDGAGAGTLRVHRSADPGRPALVVVRVAGSPAWEHALATRDLLRDDPRSRDGYAERKRVAAALYSDDPDAVRYAAHTAAWRNDPDG